MASCTPISESLCSSWIMPSVLRITWLSVISGSRELAGKPVSATTRVTLSRKPLSERLRVAPVLGIDRDARRAGHVLLGAAQDKREEQLVQELLRDDRGVAAVVQVVQQHDELVAALARDRVLEAHAIGKAPRDLAQQ